MAQDPAPSPHDDASIEYRERLDLSWFDGPEPPGENTVSLTLQDPAGRLEETALELHTAHHAPETAAGNILVALTVELD